MVYQYFHKILGLAVILSRLAGHGERMPEKSFVNDAEMVRQGDCFIILDRGQQGNSVETAPLS